jgi:uncharacterized membrane protein YebE (DUF533 family)
MSDDTSRVLTAIHVWAAAAWADDLLSEQEEHAMRALISVARLTDEERARAQEWIDHKVSLDDVAIAQLPADERLHIYAAACGVMALDQTVAGAERRFLERLGTALEIDAAQASRIQQDAGL